MFSATAKQKQENAFTSNFDNNDQENRKSTTSFYESTKPVFKDEEYEEPRDYSEDDN